MPLFGRHKIVVDSALHERLVRAADVAGYATVNEFVTHALEKAVQRIEQQPGDPQQADQQQIDAQLRGLGYLE